MPPRSSRVGSSDREVALPSRLPVDWHIVAVPGQDHLVVRCLPRVGDDEDPDDHDAQADRGEHERGGAGIVQRSTSATIAAMLIPPDQA
jgi:hypothetical protein